MSHAEHWDERYRTGNTPWHTRRPWAELGRVLREEDVRASRAVALGCGLRTNTIWLAQQGFDAVGMDVSPLAVEQARREAAAAGVRAEFVAANLLDAPDRG